MSIVFEQVSFSYVPLSKRQKKAGEKQKYALRNVSFELHDGDFLAIAGHTGSGKSTLVQHLNGLANPTEGRILWNGKDLADKKVATQARGDIGVVFQYPEHQLFAASVAEDVAFGPRNLGLNADEVDARVREALDIVHLDYDELAERSPFELSGGQQRRVAFAGVLAMRPTTLVFDEPVAGLDPTSRADFLSLIEDLHVKRDLTVVMVSHNMNDIARLADHLLVMHEGEVAFYGTPEDIFTHHGAELREIGLGIPHAQRLANELRDLGFDLPNVLYSPESLADKLVEMLGSPSLDELAKEPANESHKAHKTLNSKGENATSENAALKNEALEDAKPVVLKNAVSETTTQKDVTPAVSETIAPESGVSANLAANSDPDSFSDEGR